ncbi:MAG: hypothetical protein N4A45_10860 [Flavobacteriales bacterium]|jgi:DNA-binding CsgD family transcriptional regulator|nr:hypothetical protein [Flavobacteriales bacterium]
MKLHLLSLVIVFGLQYSFGQNKQSSTIQFLLNSADSLIQNSPSESLNYAQKAYQQSLDQKDVKSQLHASILLTNLYWQKSNYEVAKKYADAGIKLNLKDEYPSLHVDLLLAYARIFAVVSDFEKSNSIYYQAYQIAENIKDKKKMSLSLSRIGFNYFDLEDFDKALLKYEEAISISRSIKDSVSISRDLNNIAAAYASLNVFIDFEKNIKKAILINKRFNKKSWLGVNYLNLGSANGRAGKFDTAFYYLNLSEEIFTDLNQLEKLTKVYLEFSDCYYDIKDESKEFLYLTKAFDLAKANNFVGLLHKSSSYLKEFHLNKTDTTKAFEYLAIEHATKDSLNISGNLLNLKSLQFKHQLQKKEQKARLEKQRDNFFTNLIILSCVTGIIILLLLFLKYRLKLKYKKLKLDHLQNKLDFKNRELTTNILSALQQKSSISELSEQVKKLKEIASKPEVKHKLKQITMQLTKLEDKQIWSDFEKYFNEVHPDFHNNLHQQFPSLTPNEKRLCAFLKLNMSSKNISELTGQKVESLEKARTRLRKKLGLTNSKVNLGSYLAQY